MCPSARYAAVLRMYLISQPHMVRTMAGTKGSKRDPIDWSVIKREYELGALLIRAISRLYKISDTSIRTRRDKYQWSRKLAPEMRRRVREELVRNAADQQVTLHPESAPTGARLLEGEFIVEEVMPGDSERPSKAEIDASKALATCKYDASIMLADCKHPECGYKVDKRFAVGDPDLVTPEDEVNRHQELVTQLATMRVTDVVVFHQNAASSAVAGAKRIADMVLAVLDRPEDEAARSALFRFMGMNETLADVLRKASGVLAQMIPIVRLSYGIGDDNAGEKYDDYVAELEAKMTDLAEHEHKAAKNKRIGGLSPGSASNTLAQR